MMSDAFGDALQKITSAAHKPSSPAEIPSGTDTPEAASTPESNRIAPPSITIIEESRSVESSPREVSKLVSTGVTTEHPADVTSAGLTDPPDTQTPFPSPVDESRSPLTFLLDHRRQTAAVVVLICIAAIWSDDGTSQTLFTFSNGQPSQSQSSAETDADSMLSDFDAIQVQPLREPADPVELSPADPFPFSIPTDEAEASVSSDTTASNVSQATNQIPPTPSPAAATDSASEQSPFSPVSSSASHSVRFTGQIEPLK